MSRTFCSSQMIPIHLFKLTGYVISYEVSRNSISSDYKKTQNKNTPKSFSSLSIIY